MTDSFLMEVRKYCKKHGSSDKVRVFWITHPRCEISDCRSWSAHPHHIRTRGAGGDDESVNLMGLCTMHHTQIHQIGSETFGNTHPEVELKIKGALERSRV